MQLIIISGPSGSGKTTTSNLILKKIKDGIILNTDNYYRTGIISQLLSKIIKCYFDRRISFNFKRFKEDVDFIFKNGYSNYSYKYNFKSKSIKKTNIQIKNIKFVIVEGIFGHEILKYYSNHYPFLIQLKTKRKSCLKRIIKRDFKERGKSKNLAKKDFIKAWELFYKDKKKNNSPNYLKKIIIRNKKDVNLLLNKITTIEN